MRKEKLARLTIYMKKDIADKLYAESVLHKRSHSSMANFIIFKYLNQQNENDDENTDSTGKAKGLKR